MTNRLTSIAMIFAILLFTLACNKSDKQLKSSEKTEAASVPELVRKFNNKKVYAIGLTGESWDTGSSFMDYYTIFEGKTYEWEEDDDSMVLTSKQPDQKGNINQVEMYFRQSPQNEDGVILYRMRANRKELNDKELYQVSMYYADLMHKLKKELKKKTKSNKK